MSTKVDLKTVFAGLDTEGLSIYQWENEVRVSFPSRLHRKASDVASKAMNRLNIQTGLGVYSDLSAYMFFRVP